MKGGNGMDYEAPQITTLDEQQQGIQPRGWFVEETAIAVVTVVTGLIFLVLSQIDITP